MITEREMLDEWWQQLECEELQKITGYKQLDYSIDKYESISFGEVCDNW